MNRWLLKSLLMVLILLFSTRAGYAQNIQLNNNEKTYVLSHPMFLVDDRNIPINQLPHKNFKASKFPVLSLGATTSAVWIKISIQNKSKQNNWHIQIDSPPVLQSVSVYQQKNGRLIKVFTRDMDTPKGAGDVRVNNLMIPITIPVATEAEFYIKASSNNILRLPIKVTTLQNALEESYRTDLLHGIVFGMLIAFAIYNLFVYIITKEQPYLHYLGYIFFWSLNVFFYNGFLPDILSDLIWLNSAGTIIAIASILSVIFTNSFLQTRNNSPFSYKIRWLMCFISLVILFTDIFWKGPYSFMIVQYMMYPFFLYWFGAGIQSLKNGYKPAIYFILGFGFLMLGNAIYNLKDLDILPDNLLTRTSMHWGTLLEALILSFALASRLNFYRKQQEQFQLTTIEEKRAFLRELLRRQEQEKRRIAMELHDNIGQQLILIKNRCWRLQQLSRDDMKKLISHPIQHIASIMAEVREILHRLRPYQMDLLFIDSGDGMVFRGNIGEWYNPDTKEFHITKNDAADMISQSLEAFKEKLGKGNYPKEVFIHAKTLFDDEEWSGFTEMAAGRSKIIGVRIQSTSQFKLYRDYSFCVPRGMAMKIETNKAFLWTKGFIPRLQTQVGLETPNPIVVEITRGEAAIEQVCKDILALTKLNYNACIFADGQPVTLRFADSIGEVLTAGKNVTTSILPFKHYV